MTGRSINLNSIMSRREKQSQLLKVYRSVTENGYANSRPIPKRYNYRLSSDIRKKRQNKFLDMSNINILIAEMSSLRIPEYLFLVRTMQHTWDIVILKEVLASIVWVVCSLSIVCKISKVILVRQSNRSKGNVIDERQ